MANARVLVVDDYPGARYLRMRILLDERDFDVAEESLGRDAVKRVSGERFDLLVLDLHLPDISGVEVCRALRADPRTAALPILMMSAVSDHEAAEQQALAAGANAFVADAADPAAFLAAVRGLVAA